MAGRKQQQGELQSDPEEDPSLAHEMGELFLQLDQRQQMNILQAVNPGLWEWCAKHMDTKGEEEQKAETTTEGNEQGDGDSGRAESSEAIATWQISTRKRGSQNHIGR